ncbi:MAG: hypothetical protein ACFB15_19135 [Cyclobacteriaceae bacterium]
MKFRVVFILLFAFQFTVFAQKVDYSLPKTHQKFLKKKEYRQLLDYTFRQLEGYDIVGVNQGMVSVRLGEYPHTFSLLPLIEQGAEQSQQNKELIIQDYVSSLIDAYHDQQLLTNADFSTVKKFLTLRLFPETAIDNADRDRWIVRSDIEGIAVCVALDLPNGFATVDKNQLAQWGINEEEVFQMARENSQTRPYEVHQQSLEGSTELIALGGGDYAANATFVLDQVVPEHIGQHGAVVAVPHRDMVLLQNLGEEELADYQAFIRQLHGFVLEQYNQHATPVSPHFYWYYQGKFTRIRLGKDPEGNLHIIPPSILSWRMKQ